METTEPQKARTLPLSRQMVNQQTSQVFAGALAAKAKGEPVGWSTAIFPQEVCEALGVPILYPENMAASISARHLGDEFITYAEGSLRYPLNICSYARLNIGLAHKLRDTDFKGPEPTIVLPDFLLLANNSCTQLMKWYEALARDLHIPIFFIDCLYNYGQEPPAPYRVKYVRSQIESYIKDMEAFLGRKLDAEKFLEIQRISQENCRLFDEIVEMNAVKPSPMSGFDLFNYMSCLVLCRGKKETTGIFRQLKQEVAEHLANHTSTFPGEEKYRVHWEGIACWPNLGYNLKTLKKYGVNAVINGYVTAWSILYQPGDLDGMAMAYQVSSTNSVSTKTIMQKRCGSINRFGCEGMLCHVNHSCKLMTSHIFGGRDLVEHTTGVPCVNFDGDQSDTRVFSEAQFDTRVQGLTEIMNERKAPAND